MIEDKGKIPELGSKDNFDRGDVDLGKTATKKKNIPIVLACIGFGAIVIIFSLMKMFSLTSSNTQEEASPLTGDALLTDYSQDDASNTMTLANQLKAIRAEEEERKRLEELNRQKEAERLRKLNSQENNRTDQNSSMPPPNVGSSQQGQKGEPELTPFDRKRQGDVLLAFDGGNPNNNTNNTDNSGASNTGLDQSQQVRSSNMNDDLTGTIYPNGYAYVRNDLDYLLIHGTNISCVLKTKIVTAYKGLTICQLTKDVYSANGKTLLFEKGSNAFGEQKVAITQGKARVFVNWTDIETPYGVRTRIDSLGTDTLGASGQEAWIDSHFKERFGAAILLSFLDSVFRYAENSANDNSSSNGFTFNNNSNSPSDMASKILENSINIPPTGYVNQGVLLNILVARDIDMRNVYTKKYRE